MDANRTASFIIAFAFIRELLGEAFSSGGITTLAFDLFHEIYQDFTAGMTRSQKITMVVDKANRSGKIPELLAYVQRQNAYQYGTADLLNSLRQRLLQNLRSIREACSIIKKKIMA